MLAMLKAGRITNVLEWPYRKHLNIKFHSFPLGIHEYHFCALTNGIFMFIQKNCTFCAIKNVILLIPYSKRMTFCKQKSKETVIQYIFKKKSYIHNNNVLT